MDAPRNSNTVAVVLVVLAVVAGAALLCCGGGVLFLIPAVQQGREAMRRQQAQNNPLALGELAAGQTVLDLGCGAGLDSILAARRVGPTGKVLAVDMAGAMLDKARRNAAAVGISNIEWHLADAENLPVADGTVDVVITNGVLNLCQDKPKVLSELHRVLRPSGRLQLADILLHENVTAENVAKLGTWSD